MKTKHVLWFLIIGSCDLIFIRFGHSHDLIAPKDLAPVILFTALLLICQLLFLGLFDRDLSSGFSASWKELRKGRRYYAVSVGYDKGQKTYVMVAGEEGVSKPALYEFDTHIPREKLAGKWFIILDDLDEYTTTDQRDGVVLLTTQRKCLPYGALACVR